MSPHASMSAAIRARSSLSAEQVRVLKQIASGGAGVDIIKGAAGTGKTYVLFGTGAAKRGKQAAIASLAQPSPRRRRRRTPTGCCHPVHDSRPAPRPPARAHRGPGPRRQHGRRRRRGLHGRYPQARQTPDSAQPASAKVVLVGDPFQLPEIDAGGAFVGLAARLQPRTSSRTVANSNRGNATRSPNSASAMPPCPRRLRSTRPDTSSHGNEELREQLVDDWWASRRSRERRIMLAARNTDVDDLNRRARQPWPPTGRSGPTD